MTPQPDTQLESSLTRTLAMLRRIEDSILVLLLMTMIGVPPVRWCYAISSMLVCIGEIPWFG